MKIGILGGAYDPPHLGHLIVAEQIQDYLKLDEVWLMPVYSHPFDKKLSSPLHRFTMTQLIETETIKASDFEYKKNKNSYTIGTMRLLEKQFPKDTFYWCMGSDLLAEFYKWHEWESLIRDHNIIVYPRGTGVIDLYEHVCQAFHSSPLPKNVQVFDHDNVVISNISSTLVRERLKQKKSIKYIVPDRIIDYIKKHNLYSYDSPTPDKS